MFKGVPVSPKHNAKLPSSKGEDSDEEKSPVRCVSTYSISPEQHEEEDQDAWRKFESIPELLKDFCHRTSSHGIPHIGKSRTLVGKLFWTLIFIACSIAFYYQTYWTIWRFVQYNTIIEMELKFEAAPFPAVTVCNLNAYKYSSVQRIPEMQEGLAHFAQIIKKKHTTTTDYEETVDIEPAEENSSTEARNRKRRDTSSDSDSPTEDVHSPVYVTCRCKEGDRGCVLVQDTSPRDNTSICLCFQRANSHPWPCYLTSAWTEEKCYFCSKSRTCTHPGDTPNLRIPVNRQFPCLCQRISNLCVQLPPGTEVEWYKLEQRTVTVTTPLSTTSTASPELVENLGIQHVEDKGTVTTKTKEWLIAIGASLNFDVRKNLSYSLREFVLTCSFNSEDCKGERDFKLHLDPIYGNCFTFNYNNSVTLTNSRAGPMYGLRLLLNVNQPDYLPTTEAAGVRLVVHEQDMEAFPDTFGYSAPVGFVSSFGLKTKVISRLGPPHGLCRTDFRPKDYIYGEQYSSEGCYRSCFQRAIVKHCGCGDPRFPVPGGGHTCKETKDSQCLKNMTKQLGSYYHIQEDCECVQPCEENIFETAYSAAAWPADNCYTYLDSCPEQIQNDTIDKCSGWLRKNTAFIEVYYEQLNFEFLKETEAYTIVNLLSDFGGNIGLWIGFSAITVVEWVELMFEFFYFCYYFRRKRTKRRKRDRFEMHYVNTNAVEHHGFTQANRMGLAETELG